VICYVCEAWVASTLKTARRESNDVVKVTITDWLLCKSFR